MKRHLLVLVIVLVFVTLPLARGDLKEARITSVEDSGVDEDGDGHFESLRITITLSVVVEGKYRAVADLSPSGVSIYSYTSEEILDTGEHQLLLDFPAQELYSRGVGGSLKVHLSLYSGGELVDEVNHTTRYYNADSFSPPPKRPYSAAKVSLTENSVILSTDMVTISVKSVRPVFEVGYTVDSSHSMVLTFDRLEVVEDNGDGKLGEGDQVIATGSLRDTVWELNSRFEDGYEGELSAVVPLLGPGGVQLALAQLSIYFTAANLSQSGYYLPFRASIKVIGEIEGSFLNLKMNITPPQGCSMEMSRLTDGGYEFPSSDGGREYLLVDSHAVQSANFTGDEISLHFMWSEDLSFGFRLGVDPSTIPPIGRRTEYLRNNIAYMLLGVLLSIAVVGGTIYMQYRRGRR